MNEKEVYAFPIPIPSGMTAADFAALTEYRQKLLISLLHNGEQTLTRLVESVKGEQIDASTALKALKVLEDRGMVEKTPNKTHKLLLKGKFLALMLLKPNGRSAQEIKQELDNLLKEDFNLTDAEQREEIVESCSAVSETLNSIIKHGETREET